ncbi:MAG: DUF1501 domain-containing protein, partial [Pikeienuella sp.]
VVIILRGGMDGLGVFAPLDSAEYRNLRPNLSKTPQIPLADGFGMDQRLAKLQALWASKELAIAHAVSTPYRDKRSHFDGQDLLESGLSDVGGTNNGWLNRALSHMPDARAETLLSVGRGAMLLTSGPNPAQSWAPGEDVKLVNDERGLLTHLFAHDPLFAQAAEQAFALSATDGDDRAKGRKATAIRAQYAADRLSDDARIAAFSIGGWDSHAQQKNALNQPLSQLADAMTVLKDGLGHHWERTLVIAMTEFGRTAHENGNRGTDHGAGGAALLAGGTLRGGHIYADWPGLAENDLYQGRDLKPTMDVRQLPALALISLFGLSKNAVMTDVFPGLDMRAGQNFLS